MKDSKSGRKTGKSVWKRTKVQNLLQNSESGRYYARFRVAGKQKWISLKTDVYTVAKLRLADAVKAERRLASRHESKNLGRLKVGEAMDLYLREI